MSKASQIIVLCEDKAHEMFVMRFLKKGLGVRNRMIRPIPYPCGEGSAKRHVEDKIEGQVNAIRNRQSRASTILIVVRDADEESVDQVRKRLEQKIIPPRCEKEPIALIIPKWHIETWFAYLAGETVDESGQKTYKNKYGKISESKQSHSYIDQLAETCRKNESLTSPPNSLLKSCAEFNRVQDML
ncbi:hypothetical protein GF373_04195 [bacterium]|nr:hypothetical protein [bacterium]